MVVSFGAMTARAAKDHPLFASGANGAPAGALDGGTRLAPSQGPADASSGRERTIMVPDNERDALRAPPTSSLPEANAAEAVDTPTAASAEPATGPHGPGYGDATPVDPQRADPADPSSFDADYERWRIAHMKHLDEAYAAWRQTGASQFPDDFDTRRMTHHTLRTDHSAAGLPLVAPTEEASEMTKTSLLFERS
jgi:hypothetical protein